MPTQEGQILLVLLLLPLLPLEQLPPTTHITGTTHSSIPTRTTIGIPPGTITTFTARLAKEDIILPFAVWIALIATSSAIPAVIAAIAVGMHAEALKTAAHLREEFAIARSAPSIVLHVRAVISRTSLDSVSASVVAVEAIVIVAMVIVISASS
mmetsp:Transcript_2593/g.4456  ORF Transcript_2593/g.4456 Transcript_2593/m.4456 type:complete len:154 (-) Transcript_2593:26-487(-)